MRRGALAAAILLAALAFLPAHATEPGESRLDGFNVIVTHGHPFGSPSARLALATAKRLGAKAIAIVPFLWQASATSPDLVRGKDMTDDELRAGIRDAHALGLAVLVKPHVWVPESWAGTVAMRPEAAWRRWFANYRCELIRIARIADAEKAEALSIGTELTQTSQRPEWVELIADMRSLYSGRLTYIAHNVDEAEQVPFWDRLDAIGVTLYPPLGADDDRERRRGTMRAVADRLEALSTRAGKQVVVGEIGLRSARGAAAMPWQSAEERAAVPDPALQADVIGDWLAALARPSIGGVLIWRWFTDPDAGGPADTDFTVQGKPTEQVLQCAWLHRCGEHRARAD